VARGEHVRSVGSLPGPLHRAHHRDQALDLLAVAQPEAEPVLRRRVRQQLRRLQQIREAVEEAPHEMEERGLGVAPAQAAQAVQQVGRGMVVQRQHLGAHQILVAGQGIPDIQAAGEDARVNRPGPRADEHREVVPELRVPVPQRPHQRPHPEHAPALAQPGHLLV
jgi:hypothetical protein